MHQANHYNTKYFPDPGVFRPERWEQECDSLPAFVLGGFSSGARSCIGKTLAILEAKIAIIKILKRYKEIEIPKKELNMQMLILYQPEPFDIIVTPA